MVTASSSGTVKAFVDGNEVTLNLTSGTFSGVGNTVGGHTVIGGDIEPGGAQNQYLTGRIFGVSMWDRALTDAEASDLATTSLAGDEVGLVVAYNAAKTDAGNLTDLTANGNDATLAGLTVDKPMLAAAEDATNGDPVGRISVTDPDAGDTHTFELTDDADGRFAIDTNTGVITVADASQLDHETDASHDITVRVTDAAGETYDETFTIDVSDVNETPTDLLTDDTGLTLNINGNDQYFITDTVSGLFSDPAQFTAQVTFASTHTSQYNPLFSYAVSGSSNEFLVGYTPSEWVIYVDDAKWETGVASAPYLDGEPHTVSVSRDANGGAMTLYINGTEVAATTGFANNAGVQDNGRVVFGHEQDSVGGGFSTNQFFRGTLYDARLYDTARNAEQVAEDATNAFPDHDDLNGWWRFSDKAGGIVADELGQHELSEVNRSAGTNADPIATASGDWATPKIAEDANNGDPVFTVHAVDADASDTHTFALTDDAGGRFAIDNNGVITVADAANLDHEASTSHAVTVEVTDSVGNRYEEAFEIAVTSVNEAPTDATLDNTTVPENAVNGTLVGTVQSSDPDDVTRINGEAAFIRGGSYDDDNYGNSTNLIIKNDSNNNYDRRAFIAFDLDTVPQTTTQTLRLYALPAGGRAPTGIGIGLADDTGWSEGGVTWSNQPALVGSVIDSGVVVGSAGGWVEIDVTDLVTDARNAGHDHLVLRLNSLTPGANNHVVFSSDDGGHPPELVATSGAPAYSLADDAGGRFAIDANTGQITVADGSLLDHETDASHDVTVRVTDAAGATYDETFTIDVGDVNEAPTVSDTLVDATATEDQPFTYTLPEAGGGVFALSNDTTVGGQAWLGSLGMDFDTTQEVTLTHLGAFDSGGDGLNDTITVRIYERNTQTLMAEAVVPAGTATYFEGGHRYVALPSAITLPANFEGAVVAFGFDSVDRNGNLHLSPHDNADRQGDPIQFVGMNRWTNASGAFPTNEFASDDPLYAAGSFLLNHTAFTDVDDGDSLTYTATLDNGDPLPAWLSFDADSRTFTGTPANSDVGSLAVRVTATDSDGLTAHSDFEIQINNVNDAPTVDNALSDQNATEDAAFTYAVPPDAFGDDDLIHGDRLIYTATLANGDPLPHWLTFDQGTATFSGTPNNDDVGSLDLRVTATDAGTTNEHLHLTFNSMSGFSNYKAGVQFETLTGQGVAGGDALQVTTENTISVGNYGGLRIPTGSLDIEAGDSVRISYWAKAVDAPGAIQFSHQNGSGGGSNLNHIQSLSTDWQYFERNVTLNMNQSALYIWSPGSNDPGFRFALDDLRIEEVLESPESVSNNFTLVVANVNDAPTVDNVLLDQNATEDSAFAYQFASDAFGDVDDGDSLTYTATLADGSALPGWLSFDDATRTFTGTPGNSDVGSVDVRVTATDNTGASVTDDFALTVTNVNDAPTDLTLAPTQAPDNLIAVRIQPEYGGWTEQPPKFKVYADGVEIAKGVADWADGTWKTVEIAVPGGSAPDSVWVEMTNSGWGSGGGSRNLAVDYIELNGQRFESEGPDTILENQDGTTSSGQQAIYDNGTLKYNTTAAPVAATVYDAQIPENAAGAIVGTVTGTDPDAGDTLTFSVDDARFEVVAGQLRLKDAISLDHESEPTVTVVVTAQDAAGETHDETLVIQVADAAEAPTLITIDTNTLNEGTLPETIVGVLSTQDGDDVDQYTYSLVDNADGRFKISEGNTIKTIGTQTFDHETEPTIDLVVRVTDDAGNTHDETLTLTIADVNDAPIVTTHRETGGLVTIEAERFSNRVDRDDGYVWTVQDNANASDGQVVTALQGGFAGILNPGADDPRLDYQVTFETPGTYYVWIRGFGSGSADSAHIGLNGTQITTQGGISDISGSNPNWGSRGTGGNTISLDIPAAGDYTLNLWPREDGVSIDKLLLTTDPSYTPSGTGPSDHVNPLLDQTADEDAAFTYQFDANAFTDPDAGDSLTYTAALADGSPLPSWLSFDDDTRTFSGTPANDDVGSITLRVTATDNAGASVSDDFTLVVVNTNDAPTVDNTLADQVTDEDAAFTYQFASDAFGDLDVGDSLTYTAALADGSPLPSWLSFDDDTRTFSGTPANDDVGSITLRVTATDNAGSSITDDFALVVTNINDAPEGIDVTPVPINLSSTATISASSEFDARYTADRVADGETISNRHEWASRGEIDPWLQLDWDEPATLERLVLQDRIATNSNVASGTLTFSDGSTVAFGALPTNGDPFEVTFAPKAGIQWVRIDLVADGNHVGLAEVQAIGTPATPAIVENSVKGTNVMTVAARDADAGDTHTFALTDDANGRFAIDENTGLITVADGSKLDHEDTAMHTLRVQVTDAAGETYEQDVAINVVNVAEAVQLTNPISGVSATEDAPFSFAVPTDTFTDPDGQPLTLTGHRLPPWLSFDSATNTFSGTPTQDDVGTVNLQIRATDGDGFIANQNYVLAVVNTNDAPVTADTALAAWSLDGDLDNDVPGGSPLVTLGTPGTAITNDLGQPALEMSGDTKLRAGLNVSEEAMTLTMRFRADAANVGLFQVEGGGHDRNVWLDADGKLNARLWSEQTITTAGSFDDGQWHELTYTYGEAVGGQKLFVDGTEVASGTKDFSHFTFQANVAFGDTSRSGGLVGAISDLAIYSFATPDGSVNIDALLDQNAQEGSAVDFAIPSDRFVDFDEGDTLSLTATLDNGDPLPAWLTFDAATQTFSGTAPNDAAGTYAIEVTATDDAGESVSETFTLAIANVNLAPDDLNLTGTSVNENATNGTVVGTVTASDFDTADGDTHTFTLLDDAGGRFAIDENTGVLTVADGSRLNHEAAATHDLQIRVTDAEGATYDETFTVVIQDVNESPEDLTIDSARVNEGAAPGTLVGTVTGVDPDDGETLTYTLGNDAGGRFTIDPDTGEIRVVDGARLDFENEPSVTVSVRVSDAAGAFYEQNFTLDILDANDAPSAAHWEGGEVTEHSPVGTVVGRVMVQDTDTGDTHTFALTDNADGRFEIDRETGEVRVLRPDLLDFEVADRHAIVIRITDAGGATLDQTLEVTLTDTTEASPDAPPSENDQTTEREDTREQAQTSDRSISAATPESRDAPSPETDRLVPTPDVADVVDEAIADTTIQAQVFASEVLRFDPRTLTFEAELLDDADRLTREAQELMALTTGATFGDVFAAEEASTLADPDESITTVTDEKQEADREPASDQTSPTAEAAQYSAGLWMMLRKAVGLGVRDDVAQHPAHPRDERKQATKRR
ncbi:MAG: putative Ig domain-containing protein [Planctomycetota bacterium]